MMQTVHSSVEKHLFNHRSQWHAMGLLGLEDMMV